MKAFIDADRSRLPARAHRDAEVREHIGRVGGALPVGALVGEEAARGLSANVVSRLKRSWDEEYRQWCQRQLDDEWVYLWADGIYSGLRSERERLCVLVVIAELLTSANSR